MQVIVRDVMTQGVVTVEGQMAVGEAVDLATREELDELYVVDADDRLMGIVPDYELLKILVLGSKSRRTLIELMSYSYSYLHPDTPAGEVAALFRESRHRQLPVVENGRVIGCVCRRDMLRLLAALEDLEIEEENEAPVSVPVESKESSIRGPRYLQQSRPILKTNRD